MSKIDDLTLFEKHGEYLGRAVTSGMGRTDKTAMNKKISTATAFREAALENREKLIETLMQLAIYTSSPVPQDVVQPIVSGEVGHVEAGMAIALGIMTEREIKQIK